jgi:hypothetical protein
MDPRRSGCGAEQGGDLRVFAARLYPEQKDLSLEPGQAGETLSHLFLRLSGCEISVGICSINEVPVFDRHHPTLRFPEMISQEVASDCQ